LILVGREVEALVVTDAIGSDDAAGFEADGEIFDAHPAMLAAPSIKAPTSKIRGRRLTFLCFFCEILKVNPLISLKGMF
jgi:hypothetical protein